MSTEFLVATYILDQLVEAELITENEKLAAVQLFMKQDSEAADKHAA